MLFAASSKVGSKRTCGAAASRKPLFGASKLGNAERLCENSPDDLNDGMISAFVAEALHGSVYRRR
ncbi:hypothetical protein, partial [Yoonia sp. SDW83-1]|uniref:hypothetical protein n=1 Tax=Yoonia sp. SDW83-1 TaxID=3366945 RepID=UPI00398C608A